MRLQWRGRHRGHHPQNTAAASSSPATPSQWGPVTRCENFYDDYWPVIDEKLDALYEEAKKTDGGRLVIWDWYEQSPDVVAAFNERFPDIKVVSRGLTYNLSSAIISAKASGERNTDIVSGSITSMTAMYDQGFWQDVDWTTYGVPKEFFTIGAPELLPDSWNGSLLQYNTDEIATVPELARRPARARLEGQAGDRQLQRPGLQRLRHARSARTRWST